MSVPTCVVSGTVKNVGGNAVSGIAIEAFVTQPFFHTDGTLIEDLNVSTTTAADGTWSLTLIGTTAVGKTLTVSFDFTTGSVERKRRSYSVIVPDSGTANFSDIATLAGT